MNNDREYIKANHKTIDGLVSSLSGSIRDWLSEQMYYGKEKTHPYGVMTPIEFKFFCSFLKAVWFSNMTGEPTGMKEDIVMSSPGLYALQFGAYCKGIPLAREVLYQTTFWLSMFPQLPITVNGHKYRADFSFHLNAWTKQKSHEIDLCVELDGHDYHDRTPEQAKRDKDRDRDFRQGGYEVLHYTGTDVTRRSDEIVLEVLDHLVYLVRERLSRESE